MPRPVVAIAAATVVSLAGGCGGAGSDDELVVYAASSLADAFGDIERDFETANPGVDVIVNLGGSSTLVAQIAEGAPADVIATADTATMQRLVDAGDVDDVVVFARNRAAIVVAAGNPLGIASVADLADPDLVVVVCAPEVPCGAYAEDVVDAAAVDVNPVSFEASVGAVVNKVALGEADAGIAYVTDVAAADGRIDGVDIADNVDAAYPIAVTADTANRSTADAFVAHVLGPDGQRVLADAGFRAP